MKTHWDLVSSNKWRSALVIVAFMAIITGLSYLFYWAGIAPLSVLAYSFIITGVWSLISYFFSDKMILLYSAAHPATKEQYFDYYTVAENLSQAAQVPLPKLYVMEDAAPNAFATGRNPKHAVVCVTTGLLEKLDRHELEAVVAHELSHIRHYDILLSSLVSILVGSLVMVVDLMLRTSGRIGGDNDRGSGPMIIAQLVIYILAILAPILLNLMQLAISRRREFYADAGGVELTQDPKALIRALQKISGDPHQIQHVSSATADLYIADPIKKKTWFNKMSELFSTHPSIEKRIAALEQLT